LERVAYTIPEFSFLVRRIELAMVISACPPTPRESRPSRISNVDVSAAWPDLILGCLFIVAFFRTPMTTPSSRRSGDILA
jgi:hypothetical protein